MVQEVMGIHLQHWIPYKHVHGWCTLHTHKEAKWHHYYVMHSTVRMLYYLVAVVGICVNENEVTMGTGQMPRPDLTFLPLFSFGARLQPTNRCNRMLTNTYLAPVASPGHIPSVSVIEFLGMELVYVVLIISLATNNLMSLKRFKIGPQWRTMLIIHTHDYAGEIGLHPNYTWGIFLSHCNYSRFLDASIVGSLRGRI